MGQERARHPSRQPQRVEWAQKPLRAKQSSDGFGEWLVKRVSRREDPQTASPAIRRFGAAIRRAADLAGRTPAEVGNAASRRTRWIVTENNTGAHPARLALQTPPALRTEGRDRRVGCVVVPPLTTVPVATPAAGVPAAQ